jgi:DNA-binding NtrC family response regulator
VKKRPVILIVDDDKNTREGLDRALRPSYEVVLAESGDQALRILETKAADLVISDVRMPGIDGLTLLQRIVAKDPQPMVVMLTAYGNVETAVEAMKRGAYDFLMKPVNLDRLDILVKRALRSREVEAENLSLRQQLDSRFGLESIISHSPAMQEVFDIIRQIAPTQATVLVQGESGTGKELVAHAIHHLSTRAKGPFIAVHCAALSPTLLESELFGHEKGAFTSAHERRQGRFELADGGTLFLDEISEIDPATQIKLLRVLEERTFERVGGQQTLEVDIRLISATNKDLKTLMEAGRFRNDLFFRLDVVSITLPPLRERTGDVPLLCEHFLRGFCRDNNKAIEGFTPDAMSLLSAYAWPGNVRELRNVVEKMVVLARGAKLTARDVPGNIRIAAEPTAAGRSGSTARALSSGSLEEAERLMIRTALDRTDGNVTRAAQQLQISRRTLHRKLKQYRGEPGAPSDVAGATP